MASGSLSEEQKSRLLKRFKVLCLAGLQTEGNQTDNNNESTLIRCNCCYNLPVDTFTPGTASRRPHLQLTSLPAVYLSPQAMVVFSDSTHFPSELYPSFSSLCGDPEVSVRRSAAASYHQVRKTSIRQRNPLVDVFSAANTAPFVLRVAPQEVSLSETGSGRSR